MSVKIKYTDGNVKEFVLGESVASQLKGAKAVEIGSIDTEAAGQFLSAICSLPISVLIPPVEVCSSSFGGEKALHMIKKVQRKAIVASFVKMLTKHNAHVHSELTNMISIIRHREGIKNA